MVYDSSPRHIVAMPSLSFYFSKGLCGVQVGKICIAYIIKSNSGSEERNVILIDLDVHVCGIFGS